MSTPERELEPAEALRAEREAELESEVGADVDAGLVPENPAMDDVPTDEPAPDAPEVTIAFSPRQILGGFALLAAIVVWLFRRRKR